MRKEKIIKNYRKPQISIICPLNIFLKMSPTVVLTQPLKQHRQITDRFSESHRQLLKGQQMHAMTCSGWNFSPKNTDNFKSQSNKTQEERTCNSFFKRKKSIQHRKLIIRNSPYVKNQKEYERLVNVLRPVKGPTQSLLKQINKHNQVNRKNAQNVLLNSKDSFKQKITKFTSRIGLKNNQKLFIMNSKDNHIRDALQKNGWVECLDRTSTFYHLKWVYTDCPSDYSNLQQGQFFNHFKNNQQLTNKNQLRKNIYNNPAQSRPNFPPTFDLELSQDQIKFHGQFVKYQSLLILEQFHSFLRTQLEPKFRKLINENVLNCREGIPTIISVNRIKQKWLIASLQPRSLQAQQQGSQIQQIRQLIYIFCFSLSECAGKQGDLKGRESRNHSNSENLSWAKDLNSLRETNRNIKNLIGDINQKMCERQKQRLAKIFETDQFLMLLVMLLHKRVKRIFGANFGIQNWWIVKPAGVSRGTGIKIETDAHRIASNKYGKIVQKYIERPLLLDCGRKFDIRQWVLVKSFMPLEAYLFEHCYCRFSASKYSCNNSENLFIHLTNYSRQKQLFAKTSKVAQSIMSEEQLQINIDLSTWPGHWAEIKSEIRLQILKTLQCCQYEVQSKAQCFQVFGFDILLDSGYKPWILEVNMSPACESRAPFLDSYLENMAQGLIDMWEGREISHWQKIGHFHEEKQILSQYTSPKPNYLAVQDAVFKIQRFYRKHRSQNMKQRQLKRS